MSLKIQWQEEESSGYTDDVPDWMLANEGQWRRASHAVTGPKGGVYHALCNVMAAGRVVVLDYRPYKENAKEFYLGVLRLTFRDAERAGEPKVAWRDKSSRVFEKFKALVTRLQPEESRRPISEEEVGRASETF